MLVFRRLSSDLVTTIKFFKNVDYRLLWVISAGNNIFFKLSPLMEKMIIFGPPRPPDGFEARSESSSL